jgi:hypothetical protein
VGQAAVTNILLEHFSFFFLIDGKSSSVFISLTSSLGQGLGRADLSWRWSEAFISLEKTILNILTYSLSNCVILRRKEAVSAGLYLEVRVRTRLRRGYSRCTFLQ